ASSLGRTRYGVWRYSEPSSLRVGNSSVVRGRIAGDFKLFHLTTATCGGLGYACCHRPNQLVSRNTSRGVLQGLIERTQGAKTLPGELLAEASRDPVLTVI